MTSITLTLDLLLKERRLGTPPPRRPAPPGAETARIKLNHGKIPRSSEAGGKRSQSGSSG